MTDKNKFQQLLLKKAKIDEQLKAEMKNRLVQIGKLAKKENLLEWPDEALINAFKFISDEGAKSFLTESIKSENKQLTD